MSVVTTLHLVVPNSFDYVSRKEATSLIPPFLRTSTTPPTHLRRMILTTERGSIDRFAEDEGEEERKKEEKKKKIISPTPM